jgi:DNA-binding beta-propeller fold protein YncE
VTLRVTSGFVALGLAITGAAALPACDGPREVRIVYAGFDGAAYPDKRPEIAWPIGQFGLTSDNGSDTLTALDLTGRKVIAHLPVGRDPLGNDGPHHLALDASAGFVYVALSYPAPKIAPGPHAGHGSSTHAGHVQKLAMTDLRVLDDVTIEPDPGDIVLSDDGKRLVLSHFDLVRATTGKDLSARRSPVTIIQTADLNQDMTLVPTCILPHGLALSKGAADTAWVACYGEDVVAIVDIAHPENKPELVPLGPSAGPPGSPVYGPYAAVRSPDGSLVALGQTESHDVRFLDTATRAMVPKRVFPTGGATFFPKFSQDGKRLYVPVQSPDAVLVFDVATGTRLAERTLDAATCRHPHEIQLQTGDAAVLVVCEGRHGESNPLQPGVVLPDLPGAVLILDPQTLATVATLPVGIYPDRLAMAVRP